MATRVANPEREGSPFLSFSTQNRKSLFNHHFSVGAYTIIGFHSSKKRLNYLRALYIKTQGVHTPKGEVDKIYWVCYLTFWKKETSCIEIE